MLLDGICNNLLPIFSPGTCGKIVINKISAKLPMPTTFIDRSLSVLGTSMAVPPFPFFNELMLPLKEEIMVGIVLNKVMNPPAATAPG